MPVRQRKRSRTHDDHDGRDGGERVLGHQRRSEEQVARAALEQVAHGLERQQRADGDDDEEDELVDGDARGAGASR